MELNTSELDRAEPKASLQINEHLARGNNYLTEHLSQDAESEFKKALSEPDCDMPTAWNNLGVALAGQQKDGEAIVAFRNAIQVNPQSFHSQYNLGKELVETGDKQGAEAALRKAILLSNGSHAPAHIQLGILLKTKGDYKGSEHEYIQAIRYANGALPVVYFNLGLLYEKMGEMRQAAIQYKEYLKHSPDGVNASEARDRLHRLGVN